MRSQLSLRCRLLIMCAPTGSADALTNRAPTGAERDSQRSNERGASLLGSIFGVFFFLMFLMFALQMMVGAYATSAITAAGYDAARLASQTQNRAAAEARFNAMGFDNASISIDIIGENVVATITASNPSFLPPPWNDNLPFAEVDRQIIIRVEEFQDS